MNEKWIKKALGLANKVVIILYKGSKSLHWWEQHQHDLNQLRQQLTNEFEKEKLKLPYNQPNNCLQDIIVNI